MKHIATLLLAILCAAGAHAQSTEQLTARLDNLIDSIGHIYARKQATIDFYKNMAEKEMRPDARLQAYRRLYEEYFVFQFDSAMVYADKAIAVADAMADRLNRDKCRIDKASLLATGGLYGEAVGLMREIAPDTLDESLRFDYDITLYFVYIYWADYCHDNNYSPVYRERAAAYLKQAVAMLPRNDPRHDYFMGEYNVYVTRDYPRAMRHYFRTLQTVPMESRWYAMASFAIANNYSGSGNMEKYEEYLLKASISDILSCTRENLAMQDLATLLYKRGDDNIMRAERYINFAMDDAKNYNNRLRIIEISQKLPVIVKKFRERLSMQNRIMRAALWGISLLLVFVMVLLYFYVRQNRLLARHRHSLSDSNDKLSQLNEQLGTLNERLLDTNSRRERLAKLYIDLCAKYIDRLSRFEMLVRRKIKAGQVTDLLNTASSSKLSEEDAGTFLNQFDAAFLDLYPSFVSEFNALLKPGEQISTVPGKHLTTELRIFALIRLGVKESSEIASLLFYTPRTIYNYRSAMKARAKCRDTFEGDVEKLCRVMTSVS